jgi:hypothetical protein
MDGLALIVAVARAVVKRPNRRATWKPKSDSPEEPKISYVLRATRPRSVRVSARNRTTTPCPGCNEALEVPLNRGDLGLMCPGCSHRWNWYAPPKPTSKARRRLLLTLFAVTSPLLGVALFWLCLDTYIEAGRHLTPYSVSVRGYYRRDGTYVGPYHRRPPGGVPHDAPFESTRSLCQVGMLSGVGLSVLPLFLVTLSRKKSQPARHAASPLSRRQPSQVRGHSPTSDPRMVDDKPAPAAAAQHFPALEKMPPSDETPAEARRSSAMGPEGNQGAVQEPPITGIRFERAGIRINLRCACCGCSLLGSSVDSPATELDGDVIVEKANGAAFCRTCGETVKFCNCAGCSKILQSDQIAGRIQGRPYCEACLEPRLVPAGRGAPLEDMGPWQENALRHLEGD